MIPSVLVSDIQTTELIFFDPDFEDACLQFCRRRDIDCLPALDNPARFYQRTETGFEAKEVSPNRVVDGRTPVFDPTLLYRFSASPLLFVWSDGRFSGVVHFSDYNKPAIHTYLFTLISAYERSLRQLLAVSGLKNEDMLDYLKKNKKRLPSKDSLSVASHLPPFECFYLLNFIQLANDCGVIELSEDPNELRNSVMHAHTLVNFDDAYRGDWIYNLASFTEFAKQVTVLHHDDKKVNNRIALLSLGSIK